MSGIDLAGRAAVRGRGRSPCERRRMASGFTLIEVLVVVAIIALLISILLPSLARAREQSRATVCLSNLKQQGIGFSAYSSDNKQMLPWAGAFRYSLAEGEYYPVTNGSRDWVRVNNGCLYPRYIGQTVDVFYCPSNKDADADNPQRGKAAFVNRYVHSKSGDSHYVPSNDFGNSPIGAYVYALPVAGGCSPRDAGREMYPEESMVKMEVDKKGVKSTSTSPYYDYMNDPAELSSENAAKFLGPFPQPRRGKGNIHALLTDAYFGGYVGYHIDGLNILFGDFHARRVPDPHKKLVKGVGGGSRYVTGQLWDRGKPFMAWDWFSSRP